LEIKRAGKFVLGVDYARKKSNMESSYTRQKSIGFIPYVSVQALDRIVIQKNAKNDK
jgi:cysteinyl-tRNA synthetase, unknown class